MLISPILILILVAGLVTASITDVLRHRIPNWLTGALAIVGLAAATVDGSLGGFGTALGGLLAGGLILMPFYMAGAMGAGDVKLLGAAGTFLGPKVALLAGGLTLVTGAILAIVVLVLKVGSGLRYVPASAEPRTDQTGTGTTELMKHRFPYAAAISVGVLLALWERGVLGRLFNA